MNTPAIAFFQCQTKSRDCFSFVKSSIQYILIFHWRHCAFDFVMWMFILFMCNHTFLAYAIKILLVFTYFVREVAIIKVGKKNYDLILIFIPATGSKFTFGISVKLRHAYVLHKTQKRTTITDKIKLLDRSTHQRID